LSVHNQLQNQIEKAERHLSEWALIHGWHSPTYQKKAKALAAAKDLYKSLCGSEEPMPIIGKVIHHG
jgi:hypothetical protein